MGYEHIKRQTLYHSFVLPFLALPRFNKLPTSEHYYCLDKNEGHRNLCSSTKHEFPEEKKKMAVLRDFASGKSCIYGQADVFAEGEITAFTAGHARDWLQWRHFL